MVDLKRFNRWNVDLAKAISAIGTDAFFPRLFDALQEQVKLVYPKFGYITVTCPPRYSITTYPQPLHHCKLTVIWRAPIARTLSIRYR